MKPGRGGLDLTDLNQADEAAAAEMVVPFIERAPDLAIRIVKHRPFARPEELAEAIRSEIFELGTDDLIDLFRRHPELAPTAPENMTAESQQEQSRLGIAAPPEGPRERLFELNALYSRKYGFPFIVALHRHEDIGSVIEVFEQRLGTTIDVEIATAREEIASISRARVLAAFSPDEVASA
jgi:2-oxo-4-hydroxy-4-carboxy-5-ureidoimidazoline decarboxylase